MDRRTDDPKELTPDAERLVEDITAMLASGDYDWAEDTLTGIRDTVESKGFCTAKQRTAVANIDAGGKRQRESNKSWGRRYEGWERR